MRTSCHLAVELEEEVREQDALAARESGGGLVQHHELRIPALAIATSSWRCSPCDSDPTSVPSSLARPTRSASSRARARIGPSRLDRRTGRRELPRSAQYGEVDVVLDGQAEEETRGLVGTGEPYVRPRAGCLVTSRPKSSIVPAVGGNSPEMRLKTVVFPAPFGPRITRRSPGRHPGPPLGPAEHASEAPADPPQAEDRLGAFRCRCCYGHSSSEVMI